MAPTAHRFKNISSQGHLELPLIGRVVEVGEEFDVTPDQAKLLAEQPDVWERVPSSAYTASSVTELKELAAARGIQTQSSWRKQDYVNALESAGAADEPTDTATSSTEKGDTE